MESPVPLLSQLGQIYALIQANQLQRACQLCEEYEQRNALDPTVWLSLAAANVQHGNLPDAEQVIKRLLAAYPQHAAGLLQYGDILEKQGRLDDAKACYFQSIKIAPQEHETYKKLGDLQWAQGLIERARISYSEGCVQQSRALYRQGYHGEAVKIASDAIELNDSNVGGYAVLADCLRDQGKPGEAEIYYRKALAIRPGMAALHSQLLFSLNFIPDCDPAKIFDEHVRWARLHTNESEPCARHLNQPDPARRLRIGYVSPDFRFNPVGYFFFPLLKNHDPDKFETVCYDTGVKAEDAATESLRESAGKWRKINGMDAIELAELIRRDEIDILVDLSGHTQNNALATFALKPAPVQVTYIGYANTTGMSVMDYRFTDAVADSEGMDRYYTEKLVRLRSGIGCYTPPPWAPAEVVPPPVLRNGYITLGSLNNPAKINDQVIQLWSMVLQEIPESRLLVFHTRLKSLGTRMDMLDRFSRAGIGSDRVTFAWQKPLRQHWLVYNHIDIVLDTLAWNAHTTAVEGLWMGVPIITLQGDRHSSRLCSSVLYHAGFPDLIATTREEFVKRAIQLAGNPQRLTEMRRNMREKITNSPVCDAPAFARGVEDEYRKMWKVWCDS